MFDQSNECRVQLLLAFARGWSKLYRDFRDMMGALHPFL